jgi:16S rRNA (guanine(527)-N(7))-methyltransferase RsmG
MRMNFSSIEIGRSLERYGFLASADTCIRIQRYVALLLKWNQRISLTAIADPLDIVRLHFGESIFAVSAIPIGSCRLADVGTGAGFPGLALKLARPEINLTLIEANLKKCAFLSEVVRALDLSNVQILRDRMESVLPEKFEFDFLTARAVGQTDKIIRLGREALAPGGRIVMWLGENDALDAIEKNPRWKWRELIRIPEAQRRVLLVGRLDNLDKISVPRGT